MKIANYNIESKSMHQLEKSKRISEKLETSFTQRPADLGVNGENQSYILSLGMSRKKYELNTAKSGLNSMESTETVQDQSTEVKLRLIESFIFMTTGRHVKLKSPEINLNEKNTRSINTLSPQNNTVEERDGWSLVYEYHEVSVEGENLCFNSAGNVQTSDGKRFSFDLEFSMNRTFYQSRDLSIRMGDAAKIDPLILNFNGYAVTLSKTKQPFDLTGDGINENISLPTGGSGFLALDKNQDGTINDGLELFGPQSGDGFAELKAYDMDKNGWIDENDKVFGRLSILSFSEDGERTLFSLGEAGIGAIYLNEVTTQFEIKNETGSYGEIKSSSVFLKENGTAGTIHHIDLSV